jgi:DNA repair ATPase RecN
LSSAGSPGRRSQLDAFCGPEQLELRRDARLAWRELVAAQRRQEELARDADAVAFRLVELQALVEATEGMSAADEQELLARRERLRHVEELAEAASSAASAVAPDEGEGAASLAALAERSLAPLERLAPELEQSAEEPASGRCLREVGLTCTGSWRPSTRARRARASRRLQAIADLKRRFRPHVRRALGSHATPSASSPSRRGGDPRAASRAVAEAEARMSRSPRPAAPGALPPPPSGRAVAEELSSLGMGGRVRRRAGASEIGASGATR